MCFEWWRKAGAGALGLHSSAVFSFGHSLHSNRDAGWRILCLAAERKQETCLNVSVRGPP